MAIKPTSPVTLFDLSELTDLIYGDPPYIRVPDLDNPADAGEIADILLAMCHTADNPVDELLDAARKISQQPAGVHRDCLSDVALQLADLGSVLRQHGTEAPVLVGVLYQYGQKIQENAAVSGGKAAGAWLCRYLNCRYPQECDIPDSML